MKSAAEVITEEILVKNELEYCYNYLLPGLKQKSYRRKLSVDFYLPKYRVVIELDGIQHYNLKFRGKDLKRQRENDFLKTAFCKKNKILLLRIKYDKFDKIEEEICYFFDKHFI